MLNYNDYISKNPGLKPGMDAYTVDGEKLGTVVAFNDDSLTIEKGFFFPKDFSFRYDDITEITDGKLILNQKHTDVDAWRNEKYVGWSEYDKVNTGEDLNIPLKEERLEAEKVVRQKGEVRVRKVVHTEMKNLTIPVTKEEVIIERKTVTGAEAVAKGTTAFKEEEVSIPIMEEEVNVVKKPVVKEEVNIKKKVRIEQENISGEVKKEDIRIDRDEDKDHRKAA